MFFEIFRYGSWVCLGFIVYQHPLFIDVNLYCMLYCMSVFYHSQRGHIVFLPRVVFLFSRLIMGKTRHCAGCKTPLSEHTFEKQGKSCSGPEPFPDVSVVEEDTAFPSQQLEDEPQETIEATLASLLGAVKSLTTGLKEVQADNQQQRALLTNQSPLKEVPFHPRALVGQGLLELLCLSCTQCKTCLNQPINASLSLGWRIPVIVTRTTTRLSRPCMSTPKTQVRQMVVVCL